MPAAITLFESFGKLLTETMRAIQRDVLKIVLLAAASLVYRSLKEALTHSTVIERSSSLRGGPLLYVLAAVTAIAVMHASQITPPSPPPLQDSPVDLQGAPQSASKAATIGQSRLHPLGIVATVLSIYIIDRSGLVASLGQVLNQFADLAGPAFQRFFMLGQTAPPSARINRIGIVAKWFRRVVPYALIVQLLHVLQEVRHAHALYVAAQLAEAQRWPIERLWHRLRANNHLWQAVSAAIGTASAFKYLLRR